MTCRTKMSCGSHSASGSRHFDKKSTASDVLKDLDISDKTFLITGANSGIGFEAAKALACHGGHVVMACRNMEAANEAKKKILEEKSDAKVDIIQLDCGDLKSVESCAKAFQDAGWKLNCLILNAGVYAPYNKFTKNGYESTFQVNHLGQFYLTQLLLPQLQASAPSRVVAVSSDGYKTAFLGPSDITRDILSPEDERKIPNALKTYAYSKQCNIWFTNEFNKRYSGDSITANSLHPGVIQTNISQNSGLIRFFQKMTKHLMVVSPVKQGNTQDLRFRTKQRRKRSVIHTTALKRLQKAAHKHAPTNCTNLPWKQPQDAATSTYIVTAPEVEGIAGKYFTHFKEVALGNKAKGLESGDALWNLSN